MSFVRKPDRSLYKQIADAIRDEITSGERPAGFRFGSEIRLGQEYANAARDTVRDALTLLRHEGLVSTDGQGSYVRAPLPKTPLRVGATDQIEIRMPSEPERTTLGIEEGVALILVTRSGQETPEDPPYPADRHTIIVECKDRTPEKS